MREDKKEREKDMVFSFLFCSLFEMDFDFGSLRKASPQK